MKKLRVYVAGAFSDDNVLGVLRNIGRGQEIALTLFKHGFAPFTPWFDKEFVISGWRNDFAVKDFYEYSLSWLSVSDIVFVVPDVKGMKRWKDSKGTLNELQKAKEWGIPIFYDISKLFEYARARETASAEV